MPNGDDDHDNENSERLQDCKSNADVGLPMKYTVHAKHRTVNAKAMTINTLEQKWCDTPQ